MHLVFILYRNVFVLARIDHTETDYSRMELIQQGIFSCVYSNKRKTQKLNINYFFNNSTP